MTILNIRGTSGSGKSTLARTVMSLYPVIKRQFVERRRHPISLLLSGAANRRPLFVLGDYGTACGGGDTVSNRDQAFQLLTQARDRDFDVLFEGLVHSDEVRRTVALFRGQPGLVVQLNTAIELCIERVRQRRAVAGNFRPLNESNTRTRAQAIEHACARLQAANVPVMKMCVDDAFCEIRQLLEGRPMRARCAVEGVM
jgi:energy-coupling factor transporter ATP-binding protein EcfA2